MEKCYINKKKNWDSIIRPDWDYESNFIGPFFPLPTSFHAMILYPTLLSEHREQRKTFGS